MMIEELIMNSPAAHNEMVLQNLIEGKKWLLLLRVGQLFSLVIGDWDSLLT